MVVAAVVGEQLKRFDERELSGRQKTRELSSSSSSCSVSCSWCFVFLVIAGGEAGAGVCRIDMYGFCVPALCTCDLG